MTDKKGEWLNKTGRNLRQNLHKMEPKMGLTEIKIFELNEIGNIMPFDTHAEFFFFN